MAEETPKQKAGGMAYEVILAPANAEAAAPPLASSPPKDRPISGEFIQQKLKEAEERRLSVEAAKLAAIAKDKERAQEAIKRVEELNDSFSKTVEKRLSAKFDAAEERKDMQYKELQDRLKEHAKRVEVVRQASDRYKEQIRDRIERKMETYSENRSAQLNAITERLKEHEKHVQAVLDGSQKVNEQQRSKIMEKMEATLKNREEQLNSLKERLQEHEKRSEQVRQNKLNQSLSEEKADAELTS